MKLLPTLLLLGSVAAGALIGARVADSKNAANVTEMKLLRVESADLNGRPFVTPDDFTAPRTLLLIAFEREHQQLTDGWAKGLQLKPTDTDWFELPVVGEMSRERQQSLDNAMRGGIVGPDERARVVTLYTDRKKFIAPLGQTKTDTVYIVVATPDGKVLALQEGDFSADKAEAIGEVWRIEK